MSPTAKAMAPSAPILFSTAVGKIYSVAQNTGVCAAWGVARPQHPNPPMLPFCLVGCFCFIFCPPKRSLLRLPCPVAPQGLGLVHDFAPGCCCFLGTHVRATPARPMPLRPQRKDKTVAPLGIPQFPPLENENDSTCHSAHRRRPRQKSKGQCSGCGGWCNTMGGTRRTQNARVCTVWGVALPQPPIRRCSPFVC